jgi:hypothetical protein
MALVKLMFSASSSTKMATAGIPDAGWMFAQINPAGYEMDYTNKYVDITPITAPGSTKSYVKPKSQILNLKDIIIDQTVVMFPIIIAMGSKISIPTVNGYVKALRKLVYDPTSSTHAPNIITVSWGTFSFTGVCTKFSVNYTLFSSLGFPLRAKLTLEFCGTTSPSFAMSMMGFNSPDLTHLRTANAGDNLPLMSNKIYGDSKYYLELAKVNNLNSVFDVLPGNQVVFPPLKK